MRQDRKKQLAMKVEASREEIYKALKAHTKVGYKSGNLVLVATQAYLHLIDGGTVNNFVLVDEDYLAELKVKAF